MLYGFNREHSATLKRIAKREGLKPRTRSKIKYAKPLPDDFRFILGKPTANITAPNTCTINVYGGTQGSEAATGEQITAYTYVDLTTTKFCTAVLIGGNYYAGCYQP